MSRSGLPVPDGGAERPEGRLAGARYGRYLVILAVIALAAISVNTALTPPNGAKGIAPGEQLPPFAAPLALDGFPGDADVATHANDGQAGRVAACLERGPGILNVCQLYEKAPLVLALFVDGGSCPAVLVEMQALLSSFPEVRFAAVAIKGQAASVSRLVRSRSLTFPVAVDRDGILAELYKVSTCPQVSFAYPGGAVQSAALLVKPAPGVLRGRVDALLSASRARGWKPGHA
jgi:hypothetical protein